MSQNFQLLSEIEVDFQCARPARKASPTATTFLDDKQQKLFSQELMSLAQSVFMSQAGDSPHEVVFCGVDRESGSSELCRDIGRVLAFCCEQPVCLLDAGVGSLRLSRLLNVESPMALSGSTPKPYEEVAPNLWYTSADLLDPGQERSLTSVNRWKERLSELRRSFEYILIDAPGVNIRGDAAVLGLAAGVAILVIEANSTRKAAALRAKQSLAAGNVRLLGSVLYNRTFPIPERLYRSL